MSTRGTESRGLSRRSITVVLVLAVLGALMLAPGLAAARTTTPPLPSPRVLPAAPATTLPAPTGLTVTSGDMANTLTWKISGRTALPVYVFSGPSQDGPWTLVTPKGVRYTTTYTHAVTHTGTVYYLVSRGVLRGAPVSASTAEANTRVLMRVPVGPAGRTLTASNGALTLAIPPGALAATTTVGIQETAAPASGAALLMAPAYSCTPDGLSFAVPATLSLRYRIPAIHFQVAATLEAALDLGTYASGRWAPVASVTDTSTDLVTGPISHFSYWSAPVVQPHGTTPVKTSFCSGICHDLVTMPGSSIGLPSTDPQTCYNCHGNQYANQAPAGSNGVNIEAQFYSCDTQSLPASATVHPLGAAGLLCTDCHNAHRDPTAGYTDLLRSYDAVTGRAVETKPGSPAGAAYCLSCHGTRENARIAAKRPGYWAAAGGDKSTGYATSAHASVAATGSVTCGVCHDPHGAAQASLLPARQGLACTGGGGGACHSSAANAAGGSNIYSQLTTGAGSTTHHDVMPAAQAATGAKIECSSCHNVHTNNASSPISDPDNPSAGFAVTFDTSVDTSGAMYVLVGAEHDGVPPVLSPVSRNHFGANYNVPVVSWNTNEPATSWIDWGTTTAYGSVVGTSTLTLTHSVQMPVLTLGQTYHYRVRSADALGNTSASADYTHTVIQPPASPTITPVAPEPFPGDGSYANVPLVWSAVACPDGDAVKYQVRVTGTLGDWDATPYDWSSAWISGTNITLQWLLEGEYTWSVVAQDSVHTWAVSSPSTANTFHVTNAPNSCPFLFTWDGSGYSFEVDLYDAGLVGVPTPAGQLKPSPRDYYVLNNVPQSKDGALEFKVVGERFETDYLDAAALYAVDVPVGTDLIPESADYGTLLGSLGDSLHTVSATPRAPVSATHVNTGENVLDALSEADEDYVHLNSDNNEFTYQTLEIDLGDFGDADQVKLLVDHSVIFPNTAAGMALRQTFGARDKLEVIGADGNWVQVSRSLATVPKPGEFQRTDVVDITGIFPTTDHRIRMTYLFEAYIDRVAVDLSTDQPVSITPLAMHSAALADHGIDDVTSEDVYEYVYGQPNDRHAFFEGAFTKYGSVDPLLASEDDMFVVFGGGDEITLRFEPPAAGPAPGMERQYVLYTYGFYKGTTSGQTPTVGPLPFTGMSAYPYALPEHYPDDAAHNAYQAEWNTRIEGGTTAEVALAQLLAGASFKSRHYTSPPISDVVADGPFSVDTDRVVVEVSFPGLPMQTITATSAWESTSAALGVKPTPTLPGLAVSASRLASATADDGIYLRTDLATADRAMNWQVLKFDLSALTKSKKSITVRWNGHGEPTAGYTTRVAVWNPALTAWSEIRGAATPNDADAATIYSASINVFCLRCHDGSTPAGVTVPSSVTNVNATWATEFHGGRAGYGFGGAIKSPYSRGNEPIGCSVCHDSHGNSNLYHIATSVNGTTGISVKTPQQMTNLCVACHEGTVADWHGPCLDCHNGASAHGGAWVDSPETSSQTNYPNTASNCQLCHNHGSKSNVGSEHGVGVDEWDRVQADPSFGHSYGCHGCHGWSTTF